MNLIKLVKLHSVFLSLVLALGLQACSNVLENDSSDEIISTVTKVSEFSYPVPLADFSQSAEELIKLYPDGIAVGEVHGQLAGVLLLDALVTAALADSHSVLVLHEFTPQEAGLSLQQVPKDTFRKIDMRSKSLPFWTENTDKRATWELYAFFVKLSTIQNVELSYLWDSRLNPKPNHLKAHGMAKRWKTAREARPDSYIIALGGNYHTQVITDYPLDVTNSLCRYTEEKYGFRPGCITVDHWLSPNENCRDNLSAELIKGDIHTTWDYAVLRPDRCVVQAHWVNEPQ